MGCRSLIEKREKVQLPSAVIFKKTLKFKVLFGEDFFKTTSKCY